MCIINPFSAVRPERSLVSKVATHSVERYSKDEIKQILANNPVSFLQVINPVSNGPSQVVHHQSEHSELLSKRKKFKEFISKKIFIQDTSPCFYIYRQIKDGRHHIGIIGLASVDDYNKNLIKIHEQTLAQREEKLKEYLDVCEFNAEPVCLTYPHSPELNAIMKAKMAEAPEYDYNNNGVSHSVWVINKPEKMEEIHSLFKNIPAIYIADGHHRAASSARLAKMRKESNPAHTGNEPYNFFTAALFADDELTIYAYHRMVQSLNGQTPQSFISELKKKFEVIALEKPNEPVRKKMLSLYTDNRWYAVNLSKISNASDPVRNLDVSILSDYILSPIIGIEDLRHDKRASFVPGIKSTVEIEKMVDSGKYAAAFCLSAVSFEELISVADSGKEMPPKSTWIEPKLESGLLIYSLEK
jgi:uncharacterized protein (DUF1015 family)